MKKIFLLGLPGSGKSTLGKILAGRLLLPFFDLDHYIENKIGLSVNDIFQQKSESAFREYEKTYLSTFVQHEKEFVLALGGGTPCFNENMQFVNQSGLSIFIDLPKEILLQRLINDTKNRPLIKGDEAQMSKYIEETLKKRKVFYEQAHICFLPEKESPDDLITTIKQYLH